MSEVNAQRPVIRLSPHGSERLHDQLVREKALLLEINGQPAALLMALPGQEEELAAGFALTEGLIRGPRDLLMLRPCYGDPPAPDGPTTIKLVIPAEQLGDRLSAQGRLTRFACGTLDSAISRPELSTVTGDCRVEKSVLFSIPRLIRRLQQVHLATGGAHAAGIFTCQGEPLVIREDIGRHNALDKAAGYCVLNRIGLDDKLAVTTGRASAEVVAKVIGAGIPVLAALAAPSAAGVDLAVEKGLTLIGFLRPGRLNLYSHPERVIG